MKHFRIVIIIRFQYNSPFTGSIHPSRVAFLHPSPFTLHKVLKHIRKMRPQPPEHHRAEEEEEQREAPEIDGELVVLLPEPGLVDEAFPVAFDDVVDRVQLDQVHGPGGEPLRRPEDRRHPEGELEDHVDDLAGVPQEQGERRGEPGEPQKEHDGAEEVVEHLEIIERRGIAVDHEHQEDDDDEEKVDDHRREDLHQRQHPHAEDHLLHQEGVLHDAPGGARQTVGEEEPGDDPGQHPENKGKVVHGLGFEPYLEHEPENGDIDGRVDERPEDAQVRTEIFLPEVPFGQLDDDMPVAQQLPEEVDELPEVLHTSFP